ncbi:PREDICTED: uncharacterized protein At5g23160-like isoform X4 [Tarenaya hassleriana]|uniref:uncharacterized protein At5g23160-like isoform X4 n=1 Tax=Tarenaya hassleriana TaxID=28532 RepID=UPI00053C2510|nr:PREDICTED: uncharacterized protein At5g23160-like isoform X4 [Tarenaya hassleriana]
MAKPDKRTRERTGSSPSCFLGCFRFSRKKFSEKPIVSPEGGERKRKKKKNRWFSWSRFRLKNGEVNPSPIYETEKTNLNSNAKKESDKSRSVPVISHVTDQRNSRADDKAAKLETEEKNTNKHRDIIPDTCHKRTLISAGGKPDPNKTGKKPNRVGKFDPVDGMSIIMVTLAIMLIWGRVCAVLCASAWCYFLPRLRDAAAAKRKRKRCRGDNSGLDLNSDAYKRKVILEGFLRRQNRVSL